ncbi:MAG: hypothetical protein ACRD43_07960 [Pyrinomonadaceae bacterium]
MFRNIGQCKIGSVLLLLLSILPVSTLGQRPRFNEHPINLYKGKLHLPTWARRVQGTEWRDQQNKLVEPPSINFAGKYYIAVHSLGAGARYYSLTDLASGRELSLLDKFATTESSPDLPNGMHYLMSLTRQRNSRLLKVRFQQETWAFESGPCHEQYFLFTGKKLLPIKAKRYPCTDE